MKKVFILFIMFMLMICCYQVLCENDSIHQDTSLSYAFEQLPYNNERLFNAYAKNVFGMGALKAFQTNRKALTDMEKKVYDSMKQQASDVANGLRTSTVISVPLEEIGCKMVWTEEELGVWIIDDGFNVNWDGIVNALTGFYSDKYDATRVLHALLRDNPYDFYWMSNTEYYSFNTPANSYLSINYDSEINEYIVIIEGSVYFKLPVDVLYASDKEYETDVTKTGMVNNAVQNARAIVNDADGLSDMGRMTFYMQRIRELSEYNYPAAEGEVDNSAPWQLIYVFDGDPDTKVVCEGFSEAFQYLCDNTQFMDSEIEVYSVTGYMDREAHMWNTVHLRTGNYLVDVTNCATTGKNTDSLFFSVPFSGNAEDGYVFCRKYDGMGYLPQYFTYVYEDSYYSYAQLTLTGDDYSEPEIKGQSSLLLQVGDNVELWNNELGMSPIIGIRGNNVMFSSNQKEVAACSRNGRISAVEEGTAVIYAVTDMEIFRVNVTVENSIDTLTLPERTEKIGKNTFSNTDAARIVLSDKLSAVVADSFSGMMDLCQIVIKGNPGASVLEKLPAGEDILWLVEDGNTALWASNNDMPFIWMAEN